MQPIKILTLALAASSLTASAATSLDWQTQILSAEYREYVKTGILHPHSQLRTAVDRISASNAPMRAASYGAVHTYDPEVTVTVRLAPGYDVDALGDIVVGATHIVDGFYNVTLPVSKLESLGLEECVVAVQGNQLQEAFLSFAREASKVDQAHAGTGVDQPYTGKGVVAGVFDTGIDPNHITFMNADLTDTRVKEVRAYTGTNGSPTKTATTRTQVENFTTDMAGQTHGTHVAGIMAGSYNGVGKYAVYGEGVTNQGNVPYYGVATESDMVLGGGQLYNANIYDGIRRVFDYADAHDMPAVVNLSLGSVLGSHDGKDEAGKTLQALGERGIIVMAAGNDGDRKCAVTMGFSSMKKVNRVGLPTTTGSSNAGTYQFWNDNGESVTCAIVLYDSGTRTYVDRLEVTGPMNGNGYAWGGASTSYTQSEYFTAAFTPESYVRIFPMYDSATQRYMVLVQALLNTKSSTLIPAFEVSGKSSGKFYGYAQTGEFNNLGTGWQAPSTEGSISGMSTGGNVFTIGSYNTALNFACVNGTSYGYGQTVKGGISTFSSYGPVVNSPTNETRPHVCAPGSVLISSVNNHYSMLNSAYVSQKKYSAYADANGRSNYWVDMQGTSMAAPYAAGTVALWLQADPSLTCKDVIEIAQKTAINDNQVKSGNAIQWGAGKLDAISGLKEILARKASIGSVWTRVEQPMIITPVADGYEVTMPGSADITVNLYDLQGRRVAAESASGISVTVSTDGLAAGVYVVEANGANGRQTRKVTVR